MSSLHNTSPNAVKSSKARFLTELIRDLSPKGLVILHGYESYPEVIPSDVDVLGSKSALRCLVDETLAGKYRTVQVLRHETSCYYWIFWLRGPTGDNEFLQFDFATDYRRNGRVFYRAQEMLPKQIVYEGVIPVLPPHLEFGYYLVKKVCKGVLTDEHGSRLTSLYRRDPSGCTKELARFFSEADVRRIQSVAQAGAWESIQNDLLTLRKRLLLLAAIRHPWSVARYYLEEMLRWIGRIQRPTGLVVAIYGTDGSGKSTVIQQVSTNVHAAFRRIERFHHRPLLRSRASQGPVTDPHGKPLRGTALSMAKLGYWLVQYWIGWGAKVFPSKVRSTLVLFDRYYDDVKADPRRYRYGGPRWFARLVGKLIPKPDLSIILDVPAEVAHARKPELALDEVRGLRNAYLTLAREINAHVVDAGRSLPDVIADVERIILQHLVERTRKRLEKGIQYG